AIGGPMHMDGGAEEVCQAVVTFLDGRAGRAAYKTVRPQAGHALDATLTSRGYARSSLHTIVVDLARPEQDIWRSLHGNARTGIKKGANSGLAVIEATTPEQWAAFEVVQNAHAREKGTAAVPIQALDYMRERLAPTGHCKLFLGMLGEECVSGMLFVICQETMLFYAGASDSRSLDASPNDPVMWEAMRWGCANGIRCLALYDTDPREDSPLYGIHRFKAKWGGELVDRPFYVKGWAYLWARERLRGNGLTRRVANVLRGRGWA
ncbi:MAG: GNAT family N-acetyltransferase, partial [Armatimonadetes bacterium]|nr:GNAT family N-acetyltransferase [Armatimonadota bacterium]